MTRLNGVWESSSLPDILNGILFSYGACFDSVPVLAREQALFLGISCSDACRASHPLTSPCGGWVLGFWGAAGYGEREPFLNDFSYHSLNKTLKHRCWDRPLHP